MIDNEIKLNEMMPGSKIKLKGADLTWRKKYVRF